MSHRYWKELPNIWKKLEENPSNPAQIRQNGGANYIELTSDLCKILHFRVFSMTKHAYFVRKVGKSFAVSNKTPIFRGNEVSTLPLYGYLTYLETILLPRCARSPRIYLLNPLTDDYVKL